MVQIEELRAAFAERLRSALEMKNIGSWGAGARLAKIAGVTPKASSKWLNGESMPGGANMLELASSLGVRVEWLEYGRGPMLPERIAPRTSSGPVDPDDYRGGDPDLNRGGDPDQYRIEGRGAEHHVMETGGSYRPPKGMDSLPMEHPLDLKTASKVGARAFAEAWSESGGDAAHLQRLANDIPLTLRIRQAKEALSTTEWKDSDDAWRSIVGINHCPREALELLDSILEALASGAIDLEEIEAITTLVKKRRNEKVHGASLRLPEKGEQNP